MNIKLHPYRLEFIFPFRIAHGVRTHTDAVFVELELDGVTAFGEATFPPYLPYTQAETMRFLSAIGLSHVQVPFDPPQVIRAIQQAHPHIINPPAYAALDMALWALKAKLESATIRSLFGIKETGSPPRSYTISVCDREEMAMRIAAGRRFGFDLFKLKMNGQDDERILSDFRSIYSGPFAIDANQAWADVSKAISFARELEQAGCVLIEQPFKKEWPLHSLQLRDKINIPVIADESCQDINDVDIAKSYFSGVNVKLQKCGGITPAYKMIRQAKTLGLKVLIGCMSESAIGCAAGEALAPLCDWNDLDGAYLVKEVPFRS
jgi:L-alanine-DL-glutamate epimerase-like enolase superfamily enzyme